MPWKIKKEVMDADVVLVILRTLYINVVKLRSVIINASSVYSKTAGM